MLSSVIRQSEKIIGVTLPCLNDIYEKRLEKKALLILDDVHHPAHNYFDLMPSGRRFRHFRGNKRFINSTYPQAVRHLNKKTVILLPECAWMCLVVFICKFAFTFDKCAKAHSFALCTPFLYSCVLILNWRTAYNKKKNLRLVIPLCMAAIWSDQRSTMVQHV